MSSKTLNLTPELYTYIQNISLREHDVLKQLREKTSHLTGAVMQISPEQGQFMALLVKLMNAKKILEIGTFTGYSALVVALALPSDGKVITCDVDVSNTKIAQEFWAKAHMQNKIDLRLGPAIDTLQTLLDEGQANSFDFIFIDADKKNYPDYYEKSLQLLRVGGLIAIDNVLWSGAVADLKIHDAQTETLRSLNKTLLQDKRVDISLIPIGDGLTLALKR